MKNFIYNLLLNLAPPSPPQPIITPTSATVNEEEPINPCYPSPCGQFAQCHNRNGAALCSCLPSYIGSPPNCRPECVIDSDCPSHLACINERCRDPCPGLCGFNARCNVIDHVPNCYCDAGMIGDPFSECHARPVIKTSPTPVLYEDPCVPSPCGANANCNNGTCTCISAYFGDPFVGCRPECILSSDCSRDRACINKKCQDPCIGICGQEAECSVINHTPMCSCPIGMTGNAFIRCEPVRVPVVLDVSETAIRNPCQPSPCGPNSQCREISGLAVCSCVVGFLGSPPSCRPECVINSDCPSDRYCQNQKCKDACEGACGIQAVCRAYNHAPTCMCPSRLTGNPFVNCYTIGTPSNQKQNIIEFQKYFMLSFAAETVATLPPKADTPLNPCQPSPCGPYSQCTVNSFDNTATCTCLEEFIGQPPRCRPECVTNADCALDKACINRKCSDPCPGSCGHKAECRVLTHSAMCYCPSGLTGDPFTQCVRQQEPPTEVVIPCSPSPCGPNALCHIRSSLSICQCLPDYYGNPYEACRPECLRNSDCSADKACQNQKCIDPCPGTCGHNAQCQVINHIPNCACLTGYHGDPFRQCIKQMDERKHTSPHLV